MTNAIDAAFSDMDNREDVTPIESVGLAGVTVGGDPLPTRTMIYGVDGIGKSTFAAESNKPIFLPTEDGALRIPVPQFPLCETWDALLGNLRTLYSQDHDYKTVVIDSADWAQALAVAHVTKYKFEDDIQKFDSFGRGYKVLMSEWERLLRGLDAVRKHKGMEIILIGHAAVKTIKNPGGDDWDKYQSNLVDTPSTSIWNKTKEWCDILLFANYEVIIDKDSPKAGKGKGVLVQGDGQRVLHSGPSAAWDSKVRAGWSLPRKLKLSYTEYDKHLNERTQNAIQS